MNTNASIVMDFKVEFAIGIQHGVYGGIYQLSWRGFALEESLL